MAAILTAVTLPSGVTLPRAARLLRACVWLVGPALLACASPPGRASIIQGPAVFAGGSENPVAAGAGGAGVEHAAGLEPAAGVPAAGAPAAPPAARLLPASLVEATSWGTEPDGSVRMLVAGMRILARPNAVLLASEDRLPAPPTQVIAVPDRLGGGVLFALSHELWRAEAWLAPAIPIYAAPESIEHVLLGLDRVYLRGAQGALAAVDPQTGAPEELGALPAAPRFGDICAWDAWHSLVIADLRGPLVTSDAGASWQNVSLPFEAGQIVADHAGYLVSPRDDPTERLWLVMPNGQTEPLDRASVQAAGPLRAPALDAIAKRFAPSPLLAAVLDGWPLSDGTALVARDGVLARVRLSDGQIVGSDLRPGPWASGRCHAIAIDTPTRARPGQGKFGFVCGEPDGATRVVAFDRPFGEPAIVLRFDTAREVLAFGNGLLAARGPCARAGLQQPPTVPGSSEMAQVWCGGPAAGPFHDFIVTGAYADRAKPVLLQDGGAVVLYPPKDADLATATLSRRGEHDVALRFPPLRPDVARALRYGTWLDGFEERRPGVIGGWVDAAGSVVGVEVELGGAVRVGEYIRDAGAPVVAGRWGFGWTGSRGGFETVDGGMTWSKELALPETIAEPAIGRERACSPVGCVMSGWMRIGWGAGPARHAPDPPTTHLPVWHPRRALDLQCDAPLAQNTFAPRAPTQTDNVGLTLEASGGLDRGLRNLAFARVSAWGPATGPWGSLGRFQVEWDSPWENASSLHASAAAPSPWPDVDGARRALGIAPAPPLSFALVPADDADHALLLGRRTLPPTTAQILLLESGRVPVEVLRDDDGPMPDVQAALRAFGSWYLATASLPGERLASVLWRVDGNLAHEIGRWPRIGKEAPGRVRLARSAEGRKLGLVVEGQPDSAKGPSVWLSPLDPETGQRGDPLTLGPVDLADRAIPLCTGDDSGWELDLPYPASVRLRLSSAKPGGLVSPVGRLRLTPDRACLQALVGTYDAASLAAFALDPPRVATIESDERRIDVSVYLPRSRAAVRCRLAP